MDIPETETEDLETESQTGLRQQTASLQLPTCVTERRRWGLHHMGLSKKNRGTLFGGPYNKDPTIKGTILGSLIFGNPHMRGLIGCLLGFTGLGLRVVGVGFRV